MTEHPGVPGQPSAPDEIPPYPFPTPRRADDDDSDPDERMTALRTVTSAEADLLCMRLEREGIPCDVKAAEASDRPADQPRLVTVFVREIDAEQATTVMARAATGSATDDDEDDMPMPDSYYVKRWTCPRCHQKELEFLPLTRRIRRARLTWLALLVSPLLLWGIPWVVDAREALRTLSDYSTSIVIPWMVAIILGAAALPWPGHRCRSCAWRSDNPPASESAGRGWDPT